MTNTKTEGEFAGVGRWTIERHSAEHPEEGTRFIACATVYLPADIHERLRIDLQFGSRVRIFSEWLRAAWGYPTVLDNQPYRRHRAYASGATWNEAFESAEEIIRSEAQKLLAVIQERK
jgi:hypothetical protein